MSKPKLKSRATPPKAAPAKTSRPTKSSTKPSPKPARKPAPKPALKSSAKSAPKSSPKPVLKSSAKPSLKSSAKPELKQSAKNDAKADPSKSIMESAQAIWLAGLGAFGKAQAEGGKLFSTLVKEGSDLEQKTRKITAGAAGDVRGAVSNSVAQVRERTQETWDRLEQVFENRVSSALSKLGVPTRKDLEDLARRIDEIGKDVRKSAIGLGVKTGFGNVMTTGVRRARDELSDLARELEEAQLAAKQAEKKAPARKKA
jgi:poly(hydroxyalkanoate) granule-associated protein